MHPYAQLPVTPAGCRVMSKSRKIHNMLLPRRYQKNMQIVLVGFLPSDHGRSCEEHPYGCGNAFIEVEGDGVGRLIRLRFIENTHLAGYEMKDDGTDGCRVCFAAREYGTGNTAAKLDGAILRITDVVTPDCANSSMRALYHRNRGYAYAELV